jgi:ClpP class serine protease
VAVGGGQGLETTEGRGVQNVIVAKTRGDELLLRLHTTGGEESAADLCNN